MQKVKTMINQKICRVKLILSPCLRPEHRIEAQCHNTSDNTRHRQARLIGGMHFDTRAHTPANPVGAARGKL